MLASPRPDQVVAARLTAQRLSGPPAATPEEVVRDLLAVQAQDPRGMRLSIRSRSQGLSAADVDAALTDRRSLVVSWLNRGTLHLVTPEDYWWLHPVTTPQLVVGNARRLRQEGVTAAQADTGVAVVSDAVSAGPQTRAQLRAHLQDAGVPTEGQAVVHVLLLATLRGIVVRGPVVGHEIAYVSVRDWLGDAPEPLAEEDALARLAHRFLVGHGPADTRDLARWAGIPLGQARRGMAAIEGELAPAAGGLEVGGGLAWAAGGLVDLAGRRGPAPLPPPRLLGPFDPVLLGWVSRDPLVGEHQQVVTTNGLFRPSALVAGRIVATWGLAARALEIRPLERIGPHEIDALRQDAGAVVRFLGLPPADVTVL